METRTAIVIVGENNSGKTTLAKYIEKNSKRFHRIAFGDYPKRMLVEVSKLFDQEIYIDDLYDRDEKEELRPMLIEFATDIFRNQLDEDIWVNAALKDSAKYNYVVFEDLRFENELQRVLEKFEHVLIVELKSERKHSQEFIYNYLENPKVEFYSTDCYRTNPNVCREVLNVISMID